MDTTASQAQIDHITRLVNAAGDDLAPVLDWLQTASRTQASRLIDTLQAARDQRIADRAAATPKAEPGYYRTDDTVYVVVASRRNPDRCYAKRLQIDGSTRAHWEYAPGGVFHLAGLVPLTIDEAARLGHQHGICVVCATHLDDPESVAWGIGPTCYRKLTGVRRPKYLTAHPDLDAAAPARPSEPAVVATDLAARRSAAARKAVETRKARSAAAAAVSVA